MHETRRRARMRMEVLRAYFQALEQGKQLTQAQIARECDVSEHAVGRVLRWAEAKGLPVLADSRRGRHARADSEGVSEAMESLRRYNQRLSYNSDG